MEDYSNNGEAQHNDGNKINNGWDVVSELADAANKAEELAENSETEKSKELDAEYVTEYSFLNSKIKQWADRMIRDYEKRAKYLNVDTTSQIDEFKKSIASGDFRNAYMKEFLDEDGEVEDYEILFGDEAKEASHDDAIKFLKYPEDLKEKREKLDENTRSAIVTTIQMARYATDEFNTDHPGIHYKMFTDSAEQWFEARVDQNILDGVVDEKTGADLFPEDYGKGVKIINFMTYDGDGKANQRKYLRKTFREKYGEDADKIYHSKLESMPKKSRQYLSLLTSNIMELAGNAREGWDLIEEIDDGIMHDKYKYTKVEGNRIRQMTREEYEEAYRIERHQAKDKIIAESNNG
ncbi:hypothetical protein IK112_00140 [Candidatus Saccharibacteria bacterium]|nr:hypothetical protein [Candidatus Saccharibacteria bacterium]